MGYAQVRYDNEGTMWTAQEKAKKEKRGLWKDFVEPEPQVFEGAENDADKQTFVESKKKFEKTVFDVEVTEIIDTTNFYVRQTDDTGFAKVLGAMQNFNPENDNNFPTDKPNGVVCAGKFSDGHWYRVRIGSLTRTGTYRVTFIDFGNSEELGKSDLAALPEEIVDVPPTCKACVLAGVKAPSASSAYVHSAANAFNQLAFGIQLEAKVELEERNGKSHLVLTPKGSSTSINYDLINGGWARVLDQPPPKLKSYCQVLKAAEQSAKDARANIWEYGDVSGEEDDAGPVSFNRREQGRPPSLAQKRAAAQKTKSAAPAQKTKICGARQIKIKFIKVKKKKVPTATLR
eukprot:TRINITY_DN1744_c0_g1_i1.p1 TRINITY_DN1744_c0_g1~~TRINITY_DN1744_c0_g1_i1.p1  ORF type:complete len:346 (-),score=95.35 TRINITY_DN1744_c0_g1_i1:38-1075(-)